MKNERVEIAKRLHHIPIEDDLSVCELARAIDVRYEEDRETSIDIVERLVDLIDPTCHNIADDLGINDKDRFEFVCDDCGYGDDLYPAYCPHCGARVVSNDER